MTTTTPRERHTVRLPAGVLDRIQARAAEDHCTATAVICRAVELYLAETPTSPGTRLAGRLLEHWASVLDEAAGPAIPYTLRMPHGLRGQLIARAGRDGTTHTRTLIAALATYLIGDVEQVGASFAADFSQVAHAA